MLDLLETHMRRAIATVNKDGFAAIDLSTSLPIELGHELYSALDPITLHPGRSKYYNEVALYWPEDWVGVENGIGSFHEQSSLKYIYPVDKGFRLLEQNLGSNQALAILDFVRAVKIATIKHHFGLANNELRLSRVMIRQMGERDRTFHGGADWHEDIGYPDRGYQQLLSVIITTFGNVTISERHNCKVGELLVFNAYDRRRLLGHGPEKAFMHCGPKSGPKMFFFFEFLGPRSD